MASGFDLHLQSRGSVEYHTYTTKCEPCETGGQIKEATYFCEDCFECCQISHRHLGISKNHSVVLANEVRKTSQVCSCNQINKIEFFCEDHYSVVCFLSKNLKHHSCETLSIKTKSVAYSFENLNEVLSKTKQFKLKLEDLQNRLNSDFQLLINTKALCEQEIVNFRKELDKTLDKLQAQTHTELDRLERDLRHSVGEHLQMLSNLIERVNKNCKVIEDTKSNGVKEEMFAADFKISTDLKEYESVHRTMEQKTVTSPPSILPENQSVL